MQNQSESTLLFVGIMMKLKNIRTTIESMGYNITH